MGMTIYDALVLARVSSALPPGSTVLTLGVPTLNFSAAEFVAQCASYPDGFRPTEVMRSVTSAKAFFFALGFAEVDALDISDYEGANVIGDLNDPDLAAGIAKRYDVVYDSGTLEHIFDIITALHTVDRLVKVGGVAVHASPANGFLDHGFWQISPDLYRSFYGEPGYQRLTSALFILGPQPYSLPADENIYRKRGRVFIMANAPEALLVFAARKRSDMRSAAARIQDYYKDMHEGGLVTGASEFFIAFGDPAWARHARSPLMWMKPILRKCLPGFIRNRIRAILSNR